MLLELARWLQGLENFFGLFGYLTFRGILAALTSLFLSLWLGPAVIRKLGQLKGGAMKAGQALSVFEAALPEELAAPYRQALTKLQEAAPPLPAGSAIETCSHGSSGGIAMILPWVHST